MPGRIFRFKVVFWTGIFLFIPSFVLADGTLRDFRGHQPYNQINLSSPERSGALLVRINKTQSQAFGWKPGQLLNIKMYVFHKTGKRQHVKDLSGRGSWKAILNADGETSLFVSPSLKSFGGNLVVKVNGQTLYAVTPSGGKSLNLTLEKIKEYCFEDDICIQVHYTDQILERAGADAYFPDDVLDSAVRAYQTIVDFKYFNSKGYGLSRPTKKYAYDPDGTLDIYLGESDNANLFRFHGLRPGLFKDAPCFDTIKVSDTAYQSVIVLPANYYDFIKGWEKANASPLGVRNFEIDLRGTLIHEMIHAVLFYYNKNLNKESLGPNSNYARELDWYVEGLARYFETFVGARHDFYSQGFKQVLPDKIRFSRGGCNYFMRYPDQPFFRLRYESALFWRFIDVEFGMASIEKISRNLRNASRKNFTEIVEKAAKTNFNKILKKFARAVFLKEFGLKEDTQHLMDVAITRLLFKDNDFYIIDGFGQASLLGRACQTDWVGQWAGMKSIFGGASVAGDSTEAADVSGYASDFFQIEVDSSVEHLPNLGIAHLRGGALLGAQVLVFTKGGSILLKEYEDIPKEGVRVVDLENMLAGEGLTADDVEKICVLITNLDREEISQYKLLV